MDTIPLSIAHIAAPQTPDSGDFVYRVSQPDAALGALPGVQTVSFTTVCAARDRLMAEADVLVIQMIGDPDLLPVILGRRRRKQLTVFEVSDNFLEFQPSNPSAAFYEDPFNRACLMQLLSLCDAMQTTTPELEKRFAGMAPRRAVFMNQMHSLGSPERGDAPLTIGWGGSLGHLDDIRKIAPALTAWLERNPQVTLALMADPKISALFGAVPNERKRITPPGTLAQYYDFLETLHIGLAPLREEEFNLCRSDVKFMEYASRGVVPLCSNVPTYSHTLRHGDTGFLFESTDDLTKTLDKLVADAQLRRRVARAAFDYIRTERSAEADAARRLGFYAGLISELGLAANGPLPWAPKIPGAIRSIRGTHFLLSFGVVEQLLHDGLAAQFRNNDLATAIGLFERAVKAAPDFYPARFFYANALLNVSARRAVEELEKAAASNPGSCAAPLMLAQQLAMGGREDSALGILKSLQEEFPEFAPAFAAEAALHTVARRMDAALGCCERALEANPWFTPAATQAGFMLLSMNRPEEARRMFQSALEFAPRSAPNHMGLGAAILNSGDMEAAAPHIERALELEPENKQAALFVLDMAKYEYKTGALASAETRLRRMCELRPRDIDAAFWLARTLERSGRDAEAAVLWRALADIDSAGKYKAIVQRYL
jgi:tetratricopeptide (TPR) repeat protein